MSHSPNRHFTPLRLASALALVGASVLFAGCSQDSPSSDVSKLVMHVQSKGYSRDVDSHKFSLFYKAKAPNTVVFVIRTKPEADPYEIRMVIISAKDMIQQEAKKLGIPEPSIEIDQAPLPK